MRRAAPQGRVFTGRAERGTILILVLMIALGLVAVTLYFAQSMVLEYRGADNDAAGSAAGQAGEGARRYVMTMLKNQIQQAPGQMPDLTTYQAEEVEVGENGKFWLIGRDPDATQPVDRPVFGLVDEASKINLNMLVYNTIPASGSAPTTNTAGGPSGNPTGVPTPKPTPKPSPKPGSSSPSASSTASADNTVTATFEAILGYLPGMTTDLAASVVGWSASATSTEGSADASYYQQLNPGYQAKNAAFESPEELRLVKGITWDMLYGEDANRNGILDPNENDGADTPPEDNRDGKLDPGLLEYVTVWSREPNKQMDGTTRTLITNRTNLKTLLDAQFGADREKAILDKFPQTPAPDALTRLLSVLEFYVKGGMTPDELAKVEDMLTDRDPSVYPFIVGRVNVNTAPAAVLACLPGFQDGNYPSQIVAARHGKTPSALTSIAWVGDMLKQQDSTGGVAAQVGPYLTTRSYQFSADVVSLGHRDRGLRRDLFVIDTADGAPRVIYRRDLTRLGWPLGRAIREDLRLASQQ